MERMQQYQPPVIGVYGISGSGKSTLLEHLKVNLPDESFIFYEGSDAVAHQLQLGNDYPGKTDALKNLMDLDEKRRAFFRSVAIESIKADSTETGKVVIVAGHGTLCSADGTFSSIITDSDISTYTHILYLEVPPALIFKQRESDKESARPSLSEDVLHKWQKHEKEDLRKICHQNQILFCSLPYDETRNSRVESLCIDFATHSETKNITQAILSLEEAIADEASSGNLQTVFMLDADRTLASEDAGSIYWETQPRDSSDNPLKSLFSGPFGYSYHAFRQAMLMYEEDCNEQQFEDLCTIIADKIHLHPEFESLLRSIEQQTHVAAVVVTCGLQRVWTKVLANAHLDHVAKVIGGGRSTDQYVMTPELKATLVKHLQDKYDVEVLAFGDSPIDIPMLKAANQAFVLVGPTDNRSTTMDDELDKAIRNGLQAHQIVLPAPKPLRLDTVRLPQTYLSTIQKAIQPKRKQPGFQVLDSSDKPGAMILASDTRNAANNGHNLRAIHANIGWYLAMEHLGKIIGLETYPIQHVNGTTTTGHRFKHENQTTIVALMRGGEPMALGVSKALPSAMFVHAKETTDIKPAHLEKKNTVVIVDSVVNSGKTIFEFVEAIRRIIADIRIVIVAGVVQAEFLKHPKLQFFRRTSLVTLRTSENKYTGKGGTDTGNRLFNTTSLD